MKTKAMGDIAWYRANGRLPVFGIPDGGDWSWSADRVTIFDASGSVVLMILLAPGEAIEWRHPA